MSKKHHETRTSKSTNVWLTPKWILDALGEFDLDPCHQPDGERPFDTAKSHFSKLQDGLIQEWHGRVWLNPPFGNEQRPWIRKMAVHGNGIVLMAARTEIQAFHTIWERADAVLFLPKRVQFYLPSGNLPEKSAPGFPVVLAAFGESNAESLASSGLGGAFIRNVLWKGDKNESNAISRSRN